MKQYTFLFALLTICQSIYSQQNFTEEWYGKDMSGTPGKWETIAYPDGFYDRAFPQVAWTGSEYIIWHGCNNDTEAKDWVGKSVDGKYIPNNGFYFTDGWMINPSTGKFRKIAKSYLPPLVEGYNSVWTGKYFFVWGYTSSRCKLYNYETNTWKKVSTINAPSIRINVNFLWTGKEIFVYGGDHPRTGAQTSDGYLYNPELNKWKKVPSTSLLGKRDGCITFWTGSEIIVWGGNGSNGLNSGAAFDPSTNQWRQIAENPFGSGWNWKPYATPDGFAIVSVDERKICFYNIDEDSWTMKEFAIQGSYEKTQLFANNKLYVWVGGSMQGFVWYFAKDDVNPIPIRFACAGQGDRESVWTGDAMLVLNPDKAYLYYPDKEYVEPKFQISFGNFVDSRDGKNYSTILANGKTWMAENLKYKQAGTYCLEDKQENCHKYGVLYTWDAAKTVCPSGWHLPGKEDWHQLIDYAGGEIYSARSLLADKTNQTGFSIVMGGSLSEYGYYQTSGTMFWTSDEEHYFTNRVSGVAISVFPFHIFTHMSEAKAGAYVRCVKD